MAISTDLFMAILAMDSYNRGYNSGIVALTGTSLGSATVGADSSILKEANGTRIDQDFSFYAQSYTLDGKTVIACRGTDDKPVDSLTGWPLATGFPEFSQPRMAPHDNHASSSLYPVRDAA